MSRVVLTETPARNFYRGSDGAYYTGVPLAEEVCGWCGRWGHAVGLFRRQELPDRTPTLVCARHLLRPDLHPR